MARDGGLLFSTAEIDEPFLIEFDDGDILAIDYSEGSSVRIDMNTIPRSIDPGTNRRNIHANALFEDVIGREIVSVQIRTSLTEPEFTGSHGLSLNEQSSYITGFSISYKTCDHYYPHNSLLFTSYLDYGEVELIGRCGEPMKIHAPDIKRVVEGYIGNELLNRPDDLDADCFDQ